MRRYFNKINQNKPMDLIRNDLKWRNMSFWKRCSDSSHDITQFSGESEKNTDFKKINFTFKISWERH